MSCPEAGAELADPSRASRSGFEPPGDHKLRRQPIHSPLTWSPARQASSLPPAQPAPSSAAETAQRLSGAQTGSWGDGGQRLGISEAPPGNTWGGVRGKVGPAHPTAPTLGAQHRHRTPPTHLPAGRGSGRRWGNSVLLRERVFQNPRSWVTFLRLFVDFTF